MLSKQKLDFGHFSNGDKEFTSHTIPSSEGLIRIQVRDNNHVSRTSQDADRFIRRALDINERRER